jgi:hypothetical protein
MLVIVRAYTNANKKKRTSRMRRRVNFVWASFMWVRNIKQQVSYKQIDCNTPIWNFVWPPLHHPQAAHWNASYWNFFLCNLPRPSSLLFHTTSLKLHKLGTSCMMLMCFSHSHLNAQLVKVARLLHNIHPSINPSIDRTLQPLSFQQ